MRLADRPNLVHSEKLLAATSRQPIINRPRFLQLAFVAWQEHLAAVTASDSICIQRTSKKNNLEGNKQNGREFAGCSVTQLLSTEA